MGSSSRPAARPRFGALPFMTGAATSAPLLLASIVMAAGVGAQSPGASSAGGPSSAPGAFDTAPWIVYQGNVGATVDLVLVHPDGTGAHPIPGGPGNRWHPDWSPDGLRLAYDTNRPADDVAE